jgi:hypothetical protein
MKASPDVCVVIPIYKMSMTDLEIISYQRILHVFSNYEIVIVCPKSITERISQTIGIKDKVKVSYFDDKFFKGIVGYNRLLMSLEFYQRFADFKFILICQLDVFVICDRLDFWIEKGLDNIGAPIFEGYTKPSLVLKAKGNNGGFCLRNTKSCIRVLSMLKFTYSNLSSLWEMETLWYWKLFRIIRDGFIFNFNIDFLKPVINEDVFWSVIVPDRFTWFTVCGAEEAKFFAYDANPRFLFEKSNYIYPMAIHAWWRYDKEFVLDVIKDLELKENLFIKNDDY